MDAPPSPLRSLVAGCLAGAMEIAITYPAEFAKTHSQLNRRLGESAKLPWPPFGREWYTGCTSAIIGNAAKVAIRFTAYERMKYLLQDEKGQLTPIKVSIAGLGAGLIESVLAVTPSESIKTSLIDDRKSARPRMNGLVHGVGVIYRERGIAGFLQGLVPTTAKQAANSATRFTAYSTIRDLWQRQLPPGQKVDTVATLTIGALAGLITVYVTQPIDTIKTRMQSIEARGAYKNSFDAAAKVVMNEGFLQLWSGAVPRLARLTVSGGVVFTAYEKIIEFFGWLDPQSQWI
ncbi:tricarboxylate transporter [Aspergillus bombycis]|uniref:Tricarboxylate transporter n=1 Tax=Aspergillus bombycis TaxID=109264 RepID=A0A1F8A7J1_9EURO|nr:tricarboxylate transporter [Aspergillus bombycis]OGM47379.1 tricarboxylate transporter [Aspergillus bombycis]